MANSNNQQILIDGDRNVVVKCVAILDTANLASTLIVDVSALVPAATTVRIDCIHYSITDQLAVQLLWDATADDVGLVLAGRGCIEAKDFGGILNPLSAGTTGDLLLQTTGWASGSQGYTIILEMTKQGVAA